MATPETSSSRQVPYHPKSQGPTSQTLIPFNMASAAQTTLKRFEQRHGNIDTYLATRLGYGSVAELHQYFSAEQLDAAALAISNLERGAGFITGDQTGIGKGRICASIMRYAQQQGKVAIFITKDKPLYADMMRDVRDIGLMRFTPFITDNNTEIPLANGGVLKTAGAAKQKADMQAIMQQGLGHYSAVFTTYSQLQTIGKKEPLRRDFLRKLAPDAILILDEAHQAGGSKGSWQMNGPPDRAEFVRHLIDASSGVFYSSATYAKRPDVMDLYARRTDLRLGLSSMTALENLLTRGGVPLQQIVASKFVASGQMLRRERSYEGISVQAKTVPVDRDVADQFSAAMRAIKDFDRAKQTAVKVLGKALKAEAKALGEDGAIGEVGAKSTNFTSLMHNCIEQGLLAQKANATVQEAIAALQAGQKPVIAVANTMGSFIQAYADAQALKPGDALELSFGDLLERYLKRSRDVTTRDYRGQMSRFRLTDDQLGEVGVQAYEDALECIREGDFSGIPISPIDYIEQQLERAGYRVAEVTGRKAGIEYAPDGSMTYKLRPEQEATAKGKIDAVARFNAGDADVILLNGSGSTGISLHASETFADQRPRHMIVAQAERDINVFMQMLGRIHRTGQVTLPSYTLLMGDVPAEKRPGAILCRKMASLNANTTAARETDISLSTVVDFMNAYGEQVVTELLNEEPELNAKLDFPLAQAENDASEIALVKKVTGRIPLLAISEQETVYSLIEAEYRELVEQAQAMGENILEADQLDLDARTVARMEVIPDDSDIPSEFTGPVFLEVVDAKSQSKPLTQLQVINALREQVGFDGVKRVEDHDPHEVEQIARQQAITTIAQLEHETEAYRQAVVARKQDPKAIERVSNRLHEHLQHVTSVLEAFPPGTPLRVTTAGQRLFYGVVASLDAKQRAGSPAAPNRWKLRLWVADSARQVTVPLSKFNTDRAGAVSAEVQSEDWLGNSVYSLFDPQQTAGRVNRQIFTGNLIKAFERYPRGKLVNYTDHRGQVRQGLIMPKGFDIQEELDKEPVAFKDPKQAIAFMVELTNRRGVLKTLDERLIVKAQQNDEGFILQAPKAKESGGQYYLDEALIEAAGSDFYSVAGRMEVVVPPHRIEPTLSVLMGQRNYTLATFEFKQAARELLGITLPEMEVVEIPDPPEWVVPEPVEPPQPIAKPELITEQGNLFAWQESSTSEPAMAVPPTPTMGPLEKRILRFLKQAGIHEAVMATDEFHLRIENEPFIPLVVERQGQELYLTHYLTQNGDMFIDAEMVFRILPEDQLQFKETAVQSLQGSESRLPDRRFAQIFSKNILAQGFAEVAQALIQQQATTEAGIAESQASTPEADPPNLEEPDCQAQNLFDVGPFSTPHHDGHQETFSPDPTWESPTPSRTQTATSSARESDLPRTPTPAPQSIQTPTLQALADAVREADLETVAANLELEPDRHDKHKWRDGDHIISLSGQLFMDWLADKGGRGAIDLVMHVQGVEFKAAVEWLSGQDLSQRPIPLRINSQPQARSPRPLEIPAASERRWAAVRAYLIETRKLPAALVDRLHEKRLVYADGHQNAVFVRHRLQSNTWHRGEIVGASLRGTWGEDNHYHGLAPGSARDQGWFWIGTGRGLVKRVLLAESPIDAMSLAVLDTKCRGRDGVTLYLSTDGSGGMPVEALKPILQNRGLVMAAFDADQPGELLAWRIAQHLPGVRRLTPEYGKDWNEQLTHPEQCGQVNPQFNPRTLQSLWQWHLVATSLGRPEAYLRRITEVARECVKGAPMSEKARVAMLRDLQKGSERMRQPRTVSGCAVGTHLPTQERG